MNQSDPLNLVTRILNKISKDNFQVLIDQLVSKCQLLDKNESIVFIDNIFKKVVEEPSQSSQCDSKINYYIQIINKVSPIFLQKYQLKMGNIIVDNFNLEYKSLLQQISNNNQDFNQVKQNYLNLCKFMGECYYILPSSFLIDLVKLHLSAQSTTGSLTKENADEMNVNQLMEIEIVATTFTSAGKTIESMGGFTKESVENQQQLSATGRDLHFQGIQNALDDATPILSFLIENRQLLPPRIRFMVKNLFELKNNKWIIPKANNDDLIAQREIVKIATAHGKSICKTLSEKCDEDSTLNSIFWKSFFQSLGIANYKILRQMMLDDKSNISPSSTSPTIPLSPFLRRSMNITSPTQFNLNGATNNNSNNNNNNNNNNHSHHSNMDIDASFDLNSGSGHDMDLNGSSGTIGGITNLLPGQVPTIDLNLNYNQPQQLNLPSGFLSPKVARSTSPSLSSTSLLNGNQSTQPSSKGNSNISKQQQQQLQLQQQQSQQQQQQAQQQQSLSKIKESPELSSAPDSNLSVIVSIIDSKIWTPQKEIWKKKIMNKIIPMKSSLKKSQKIEILAAIWQNMCDNNYEYGSYLDLCLNLIKMDEGDISPLYNLDNPINLNNNNNQPKTINNGGNGDPSNPMLSKIKAPNRRSSMATLQMKPSGISEARRSSISVPFELNRRGSLSGDIPSYCPPAPKLKSTPTLKSTPAITQPLSTPTSSSSSSGSGNPSTPTKNVHPTSEPKKQPIAKKHKPDLDSFKDVLISSLQDDFALKMFVKKQSLTTYMELLKDLYREFIIEIPLLLKCISLVHNGLYELTDEECTLLFDLEEMAQEQQNLEKQNDQQQNLLTQNNQVFQWKTNTWEEKPQTPPPPPTSYFDLGADVFVL